MIHVKLYGTMLFIKVLMTNHVHAFYIIHSQFCKEFDAIVENCRKYNGQDSQLTAQVMRLKAEFDELVKIYLPDSSVNIYSLPPLETVRDDCWPSEHEHSSSEHSSSDEEYNVLDEESTFESREDSMIAGAYDLSESSQELFHSQSTDKHDTVTTETHLCDTVSQPEPRSTAMENSVKVEDTNDLPEMVRESVAMNTSGDEDSDNDPPSVQWK